MKYKNTKRQTSPKEEVIDWLYLRIQAMTQKINYLENQLKLENEKK